VGTDPAFLSQLINTNVMQIRPDNNITYVCSKNDTVLDVWKGLNRHHFMSVPVLENKESYVGFIDLADIVSYFATWFSIHTIRKYPSMKQLLEVDQSFSRITVDKLMIAPGQARSPFIPVKKNFSLFSCMEMLARENLERLPIINEQGVLYNFLTQSHLVEYLHANINKIGNKKNRTVGHMEGVIKQVHTISQDQLAYDAFNQMTQNKVQGLAVLDEKHHIVGAISVRDLKLVIEEKMFSYLLEPIKSFIRKLNEDTKTNTIPRPAEAITVRPEDTLARVIELLVQHKLHRIFVVDNKKKCIGVVGLKEVLLDVIQD